jgi:hypothetical protein
LSKTVTCARLPCQQRKRAEIQKPHPVLPDVGEFAAQVVVPPAWPCGYGVNGAENHKLMRKGPGPHPIAGGML